METITYILKQIDRDDSGAMKWFQRSSNVIISISTP